MINRQRWFGGRRPGLAFCELTKDYREPFGVQVALAAEPAGPGNGDLLLDDHFHGPLPQAASDPVLADWVRGRCRPADRSARYPLQLDFAAKVNLGDFTGGAVKPTMDGLWPVWGGSAAAPEDWRVIRLVATHSVAGVPAGGARIRIWRGSQTSLHAA